MKFIVTFDFLRNPESKVWTADRYSLKMISKYFDIDSKQITILIKFLLEKIYIFSNIFLHENLSEKVNSCQMTNLSIKLYAIYNVESLYNYYKPYSVRSCMSGECKS